MALIKCDECGKEYSNRAQACPKCGNPNVSVNDCKKIIQTKNKKNNTSTIVAVVVIVIGVILFNRISDSVSIDDKSEFDTDKIYNIGDVLICPDWKITIDKLQIKKKGASIDSYSVINDPEWLGVNVTVKNTSSEAKTFYSSNFGLINSNGETISSDTFFYNVWGTEKFGSPELTSGGSKTGFVPFTNTNQDNSNLTLTVDCDTGLFADEVIYKVNISN